MISKNKRGQAAGAAVLLAIIAGLLIMFVILVPPADRAELLGEELETSSSSSSDDDEDLDNAVTEENLLTESPGKIDYFGQDEVEHPLPVVNIYTKTESKALATKNIAQAKKGVFTEEVSTFKFTVPDLENTDGFLLGFTVLEADGEVIISLNGEDIFHAVVEDGEPMTIELPTNQLQEENIIQFMAASPGVAFWKTNHLSLEKIQIVAEVTSMEAQSSKNIFLVSEMENKNLKRVILKFQPECVYNEVGKLSIFINGEDVYHGIPDCDLAMVPIEFSPEMLYQGENEIVFSTEKGTYLLSHVKIVSELKEVEYPTFYFELSEEQYETVMDEDLRARLQMEFVDVVTSKYGEIVFNGHVKHFDTKEVSYTIDLSDDVVRGNNALKVKPKKTLDVREIRVDLVE